MLALTGLLAAGTAAAEAPQSGGPRARQDGDFVFRNYPRASLKAGEEGTVAFRISLDKGGKLHSCVVTRSSGYRRLDEATCDLIVRYARFKPVRQNGRTVPSRHEGRVAWTLPPGRARAAPPPRSALSTRALASLEIVCRIRPKAGTQVIKEKVCLSRHDWELQESYAQDETRRMQDPR